MANIDWSRRLPSDLTMMVFGYLDERSVCGLSATCRAWSSFAGQPSLWFEICNRTQGSVDSDTSRHWKDKFRERLQARRSFLQNRGLFSRTAVGVIAVCLCTVFAIMSARDVALQAHRLSVAAHSDPIIARVIHSHVEEHTSGSVHDDNEDEHEFEYEPVIAYSAVWNQRNLSSSTFWPLPYGHLRLASLEDAEDVMRSYPVGSDLHVFVVDGYSFVHMVPMFEPIGMMVVALAISCLAAIFTVLSPPITVIRPDTTDLKTYSDAIGRYAYPLIDDRFDDIVDRRRRGFLLVFASVIFHCLATPALVHYVAWVGVGGVLFEMWVLAFVSEAIAMYALWNARLYLVRRFQAFLFSDRRPYLVPEAPNVVHVVLKTQMHIFVESVSIVASLTRVDREVVRAPGEPDRTRLNHTLLHVQDTPVDHARAAELVPGEHLVGQSTLVIDRRHEQSTRSDHAGYPRFVWKLAVVTKARDLPSFTDDVIVVVSDPPTSVTLQ